MATTQEQREMRDEVLALLDEKCLDIQYFRGIFSTVAHRRGIFFNDPSTSAKYGVLFRAVNALVRTALNTRKRSEERRLSGQKAPARAAGKKPGRVPIVLDHLRLAAGERPKDYD